MPRGVGLSAGALITAALPRFSVNAIGVFGDSITSTTPDQTSFRGDFYSYVFADTLATGQTVNVRAQSSRTVGTLAQLDDASNTLMGNVTADLATNPELITLMIGSNDLSSGTAATLLANLQTYSNQVRANSNRRIAFSPPPPYRDLAPRHPNYTAFTAERANLLATIRDPAVWGQFADYYIPMGEHPDFNDPALIPTLYGDEVHPSAYSQNPAGSGGQVLLFNAYKAFMDTVLDASRQNSIEPFEAVWPLSEGNLGTGTEIIRRFVLSGLAPGASHQVSCAGAEVSINGGPWITVEAHCYNGDTIDVRKTTSASNEVAVSYDLTISGETRTVTLTTQAAAALPVDFTLAGTADFDGDTDVATVPALTYTDGLAMVSVGAASLKPISVTIDGNEMSEVMRAQRADTRGVSVYTLPIAAGQYDVVITRAAGFNTHLSVICGTVEHADPTPIAIDQPQSFTSSSSPHNTNSLTTVANGRIFGWLFDEGAEPMTQHVVAAPSVQEASAKSTFQSTEYGIVMGSRDTTGSISFTGPFGRFVRGAISFGPAS